MIPLMNMLDLKFNRTKIKKKCKTKDCIKIMIF